MAVQLFLGRIRKKEKRVKQLLSIKSNFIKTNRKSQQLKDPRTRICLVGTEQAKRIIQQLNRLEVDITAIQDLT